MKTLNRLESVLHSLAIPFKTGKRVYNNKYTQFTLEVYTKWYYFSKTSNKHQRMVNRKIKKTTWHPYIILHLRYSLTFAGSQTYHSFGTFWQRSAAMWWHSYDVIARISWRHNNFSHTTEEVIGWTTPSRIRILFNKNVQLYSYSL